MLDLTPFNVVVFVFGMQDCPACENYIPRFVQAVEARQRLQQPFRIHDPEQEQTNPILPGTIPIIFLDVSSNDKQITELADRCKISGTPATVLMPRNRGALKIEGAVPGGNIEQILDAALECR